MNKMANNVYYTKKAKAKMRERRRRKIKAGDGDGDDGTAHAHAGEGEQQHDEHTQSNQQRNGRKRTSDQISNGEQEHSSNMHKKKVAKTESSIITIPANLTSKEAKKFRKDARRAARAEGRPDDQLKFVIEGQEPESKDDDKKKKKAATAPSFPRINDLLTQHATQQKINDKLSKQKSINDALSTAEKSRYVAIDCEMVGVGSDGKKSALARASVVNYEGEVLLDTFVRVPERVTDFRTHVSGVRPKNIHVTNDSAMDHDEVRNAVGNILLDKILVGHALKNDLSVLMLSHPKCDIRDTAKYKPFMRATGRSGGKLRPRKLRDLVLEHLGQKIQVEGEAHCSVDDARASMELFKVVRNKWEKELLASGGKKKKKSSKK